MTGEWAPNQAGTDVEVPVPRDVQLPGGELVDAFAAPERIAAYLEELDKQRRDAYAEMKRVEQHVLALMDEALTSDIQFSGGALVKDAADHGDLVWDDQELMKLRDMAPADPELARRYGERLTAALRPEYVFRPLKRELDKLARERPDLAGIISDAAGRKAKPRHLHVRRAR